MVDLNASDRARIAAAIKAAEQQTSGEIAVVLARASHPFWRKPRADDVALAARRAFTRHIVDKTTAHNGILIYVSAAERQVELLADRGIDDKMPSGSWDAIVAQLTARLAAGEAADGLVTAIATCAEILGEYFPRQRDDRNELPDTVIDH